MNNKPSPGELAKLYAQVMSDNPFSEPYVPINPQNRKKRIVFRAWRRGFKEADLIMGRFAEARLDDLNDQELSEFERLLDAPDIDVYGWICGTIETPPNYEGHVLNQLKAFRYHESANKGDGPSG